MRPASNILLAVAIVLSTVSASLAQIEIYDANNQDLGMVTSPNTLGFYNQKIGKFFELDMTTYNLQNVYLFYKTDDCSGQAYALYALTGYMVRSGNNIYEHTGETESFNSTSYYWNAQCYKATAALRFYGKVNPFAGMLPFTLPVKPPFHYSVKHSTKAVVVPMPIS
ncbi:hypothetical protein [Fundidesulfovibrio soli]|uniref:hypothetical protein n=1 Tax=Fundidesulfovibrio soli TaxID=2922716 RepID=UPI001FAE83B0|nr:hypothetical protein [Fundidesulfovibrio soli]